MGYHVNIMQCTQPNFLLTCQVYPMLMSSVPQAWGTFDRKSTLFKLIVNFFLKGVVFMFWHDIAHIELLYCVTKFELVWTWNKVAVVENAKKCRLHPNFPYMFCSCLWGYNTLCLFSQVMLLCTAVVCSSSVIFVSSYKVIFSEK